MSRVIILPCNSLRISKLGGGKRTISGKLTDSNGEPVIGAGVVVVEDPSNGTVTDANGYWSITTQPGNTLRFSSIGMKTMDMKVGNSNTLNLTMDSDNLALDELVIVGYGTQKKSSLTSSITTVETEKLEERVMPHLSNALQGLTPGVEIRQSGGRPGFSTNKFDIRGSSRSTFSSNNPLVIVDGIVGDLESVNPNDVENISILKDAAAASIYGARATGGVVLITTKKGSSGKVSINYNGTYGVEVNPISRLGKHILSSQDWMRANNEGSANDGNAPIYSEAQIAEYDGSNPDKPYSHWLDGWLPKSSAITSHNVSVRGGNERLRAYSSVGYLWQDGLFKQDDYKRYNGQINLDWTINKKLSADVSLSYSHVDRMQPIDARGDNIRMILYPPINPIKWSSGYYSTSTCVNLFENAGNILSDSDNLRMNAGLKYEILSGLNLKYSYGMVLGYGKTNTYKARYQQGTKSPSVVPNFNAAASVSESWSNSRYQSHLITLDYSKTFGMKHNLYAMVGFQSEEDINHGISASSKYFVNNSLRELAASTGKGLDRTGNGDGTQWAMASFIGRITYNYAEKYLLEATARYDGSSRFSPTNRWGFFPSVSAAWRINNESWMKSADWLTNLKLRASWGQLGNQGSALYPFATLVNMGTQTFGNGQVATAGFGVAPSTTLTWETKTTINAGLDFGFWDQRLTGSVDVFRDLTDGILGTPTLPTTFGASAPVQNSFTVANRGWEFNIKWADTVGDFAYEVGFNMSDARDKVLSLGEFGSYDERFADGKKKVIISSAGQGLYYGEGTSINSLYLYQTDGLFYDQAELDSWKAALKNTGPFKNTKPGDIKFIDRDGNGEINSNDRYFDTKRDINPHFIYGMNFGARFKNFDLSMVFNGVLQRLNFRNRDGHYMTGNRLSFALIDVNYNERYTNDNPNKWAYQPRVTLNNWISNAYSPCLCDPCEYMLVNLGYIRLKNLQFGYTIPQRLTQKAGVSKLRIYFSGENLFYIAPGYKELLDPESFWSTVPSGDSSGTVYYGPSKALTGGISITF